MRDIKFRVWDKNRDEWVIPNQDKHQRQPWYMISFQGEIVIGDNQGAYVVKHQEDYVIQQCTCVPDKNMKQIYEGDLITYKGQVGMVTFYAGMFFVEWDDQTDTELGYMETIQLEIVGHIYDEKARDQNQVD